MSAPFTFIDLFAGIGGIRLGFEAVGGMCVFTSEWDRFAQQTYRANHGEMPFGDITSIALRDIPEHDVLLAGFPCQPFSLAGVSKLNSLGRVSGFDHPSQGHLFFSVFEILAYHRPRAFMLENVKNLRRHDGGRTFAIILGALEGLGYRVEAQVIDARLLVPQHRERIYIVGFRDEDDAARFAFPTPMDQGRKLADILEPEPADKYTLSDHLWEYLRAYADKHRARGNGFGYGLPDLKGVSRTLSARYHKDGSEILISQPGRNPRRLTPRECARLMGFPDRFDIVVSDTQAYRQFGNSVVVPVVEAVARAMVQAMQMPLPPPQRYLRTWTPRTQLAMPLVVPAQAVLAAAS